MNCMLLSDKMPLEITKSHQLRAIELILLLFFPFHSCNYLIVYPFAGVIIANFRLTHRPVFSFAVSVGLLVWLINLQFHLRISMRLISNFKRTYNPYTCIEEEEVEEEEKRFNHLMQTHGKLVSAFRTHFTFTLLAFHFYFCKCANCVIRAPKKNLFRDFFVWKWKKTEVFLYQSQYMFFLSSFLCNQI